ncbi:hypothetical protein [Polynucleobacter sp. es-EL-1]|uniref:hypothetical protein n=1 Tax=Polynucleobacter sp. es-EL-1 TaxID=1855652 RepID=UPI001BFE0E06|nr:hypothetical protein [Polynucleobacter sp. es-EL-1]QWE10870.1 hypothetical protein FD974_01625 [Polynucleobacter sp. es-EL-1]
MNNVTLNRIPYKKLFAYRFLSALRASFNSDKQPSQQKSIGSKSMDIKSFLTKAAVIFLAIYFVIVMPLASSIKDATKGIDTSLNKTSTKLMLVSLISNPETLYLLANEEVGAANKGKAKMFIDTAIGIIESRNSNPSYKVKFYQMREKILEMPDKS